jgi:FLVCR family MFS transporter 7
MPALIATSAAYAGSLRSQSMGSLLRAWLGFSHPPESHMSPRERIDFTIIFLVFGVLVAACVSPRSSVPRAAR